MDTDLLAELIRARLECLVQLRDIGLRQIELIDGGEMVMLLDLLSAKQQVLQQLQRVERALDPFRSEQPDQRRWRTPDDRRLCAQRLRESESLLREIISQEEHSEAALVRRRDAAASQLQGFHQASQAHGAYTAPTAGRGQLDLLSDA